MIFRKTDILSKHDYYLNINIKTVTSTTLIMLTFRKVIIEFSQFHVS